MLHRPDRTTVDLSEYPDLVVIYLGQRVNSLRGLNILLSFRGKISKSVDAQPDGLLLHENLLYSLIPPHSGMRQYWRDFDSLERWARSLPHKAWWQEFSVIVAALGSGMRRTFAAARLRRYTWTCRLSACLSSPP